MKILIAALVALMIPLAATPRAGDDPLDAAKSLYLAASYQEALNALTNLPSGSDLDTADKYRALCFLGLGRDEEAEKALESLVQRKPTYVMDSGAESPKLVAIFREVRTRKLPDLARSTFANAKAAFEKGDLAAATTGFTLLTAILNGPDVGPELADLKLLADGFSTLAQKELSAQKPAAPVPAQAAPAPAVPPPTPNQVFTVADADVIPPSPLSQNIPAWDPRNPLVLREIYAGAIEVVVDEHGTVTAARIAEPIHVSYDSRLVSAAKGWKYRPALKAGQPVKYRKVIPVTLRPTAPPSDGTSGTE